MILTLARRGMLAHKRRLVGLCSAIALGVAFLVGTLVLSDTMRASFDEIFATANAGIDAVVQGEVTTSGATGILTVPVPDELVGELEGVDGVRTVEPMVEGLGQIVAKDGTPVGGTGPPTFAGNWVTNESLNPQRVVEGQAPGADDEAVIDAGTAATGGVAIGDRITVLTPDPVKFTVTGFTKYGELNSLGGTTYVGMTFAAAQEHLAQPGTVSNVLLQADDGVSPEDLVTRVQPILPADMEVLTGEQLTELQNEQVQSDFLSFFQIFLTVFAVIALIVSTFSIYNTFSVIAAQKTRESALLRAVGGSRRQVLGSLAGESLLIGILASAIGTALGVAVAAGLLALLDALGTGLPSTGLSVSPGSLVVGFVVGIVVTLVAAIVPAVRASRVAPLAALRDVAAESRTGLRARLVIGELLIVAGLAVLGTLLVTDGSELWRVAIGGAALFAGFIVFGPAAATPLAKIVGAPITALRGTSGRMARANAVRNPRRTASTATALMVGVAVVSMFTIFASSMKAAITENFVGDLKSQLVLSNSNFSGAGYDPAMLTTLRDLTVVAGVSTIDPSTLLLDGQSRDVTVVDVPGIQEVTDLGAVELNPNELSVDAETAAELGLRPGQEVELGLSNGRAVTAEIGPAYQRNGLVSGVLVPRAAYENETRRPSVYTVFVTLRPGVSEADGKAVVQKIADRYSAGAVLTRDEFADETAGQIDQLLGIIYALLLLAIVIALMGIANTLSLSVFERTRELGLLRAVGQTRPQLRAMVRWESVIIALFGTIGGIVLGLLLGAAFFTGVASAAGFSNAMAVPWSGLLGIALVGSLVGVLAGLRPAARAAKLNVLAAIASE